MTTVILSAGHYPEKPGAVWQDQIEHNHTVKWMQYVFEQLASDCTVVSIDPTLRMKATVQAVNRVVDTVDSALAIEFHFNSVGEIYVEGNETLYYPSSESSKHIASIYNNEFISHSLTYVKRDRGVKPGWYQGDAQRAIPLYYLQKTQCPSLIIEPCFMCQLADIGDSWKSCCDGIVKAILKAVDSMEK